MVDKMQAPVLMIITKDDDPESTVRSFALKMRVSNYPVLKFRLPLQEIEDAKELAQAGPIGAKVVRSVDHIDGPDILLLEQYELTIGLAPTYTWAEMEPIILAALGQTLERTFDVRYRVNRRPKSFLEMLHDSIEDEETPNPPFGHFKPQA